MNRKNSFLTFVFSCYPGGGHMYLGFMKQGFQLMALFSIVIAIASSSYIFRFLAFLIPILIAYSVFDAMNKRNGMIEPDDSNLEIFEWLPIKDYSKFKDMNYYKVGAYVLVVLGVYMLFENVVLDVARTITSHWLESMNMSFRYVERVIKSSILGIIFIIGGIKLLSQAKKMNAVDNEEAEKDV